MKPAVDVHESRGPLPTYRLTEAVRGLLGKPRQQEAEVRYRALFDRVPVGLYRARPDGQILDANRALLEMLGYPDRETFLSVSAVDLYVNPDDRRRWQTAMDSEGVVRDFEIRLRRRDGTIIWVEDNARAIRDADGNIAYFEGSLADITERKQAEEALRQREEQYRLLVENINDIVYSMGIADDPLQGNIQVISERVEKIIGYRPVEFQHDAGLWVRIIHPDDLPGVVETTRNLVLQKQPVTRVFRVKHRQTGEYRWLEDKAVPQIDERGRVIGIFGVARDITQRKLAEEEQERLQAQLLQAQKMEAIGTLVGGIAHDFNNLLTGITGYIELAMMEFDATDPTYQNLKRAQRASIRAGNLTRQLLLFSRRQPMERAPLDLNSIVESMTDMARHLIGEEIVISTKLVEDVWTTEGDGGQIEQVLMNLIVNARDAMPQGGRLTIATENVHVDRLYCETVRYARPGRFVCVSVSDTGVGMDREMLQRIFEPFYTTKGAGHGTGLGLSVAYGIVKQHDGWINVYSEPGRGSTFRVYFPAVPARVLSSKAEKPCCLQGFRSSGEKILVVEDEEVVREFSTRTLQEHGYVTFSAASVQEALDIFEEEDGDFSLVLSDVVLPDQTGLDLIRLLRARNPGLAVLLTSGYSDSRSRWEEIRRQGFRFLQKPFNLVELLRTLRDVLENDRTA